jgi:phosphatidylglycerol:prolipoprotein diacylglycerol transferase
MIPYPNLSPEIVRIGPFSIRWYGMMYLLGFLSSYLLVRHQVKEKRLPISKETIDALYTYIILGLLIGARLGYVIFYNLPVYLKDPLEVFAIWHGGMSFHGGLIGCILSGFIFSRRYRLDFWLLSDLLVVTAPIGLGLGRLGNFINGELYGRVTDVPWAMVFPDGGPLPRHPSQLYEFLLEGVTLFVLLWFLKDRLSKRGYLSAIFLLLYGLFRIIVEFFREPDPQIGYLYGFITMGQVLSSVMIIIGLLLLYIRRH